MNAADDSATHAPLSSRDGLPPLPPWSWPRPGSWWTIGALLRAASGRIAPIDESMR